MGLGRGPAALAVVLGFGAVGTCVFPTERDASVHVSIDPLPVLVRGHETYATARAWQILAAGDSQPLANVTFVWSGDDPLTAAVAVDGHIVGIQSGTTTVRARAANFDRQALPGQISLRVSDQLEIDSVRPQTVKYGETVTIYGVGLDTAIAFFLGPGALLPVPFSEVVNPDGSDRVALWVPPPARRDTLFFFGPGVFGFPKNWDTVRVIRQDLYEPNDTAPPVIDLESSAPFPGTFLSFLLFYNPALAFEQLPRDVKGADWYRLSQTRRRDLTIVVNSPSVGGTFQTFLTDSLGWDRTKKAHFIGKNAWTLGSGSHACHGLGFSPQEAPADSTVVALKGMPAGQLDAITIFRQSGPYAFAVAEGYATTGGMAADVHEEDDFCSVADTRPDTVLPFRTSLTIDNPHDVDWIRFNVPSLQSVRFRLAALASAQPDTAKDVDLYVIRVPVPGDTALTLVAADTAAGALIDLPAVPLTAGSYYAVVVDFAGVETPYDICIGPAVSACIVFPGTGLGASLGPGSVSPPWGIATRSRPTVKHRPGIALGRSIGTSR